ncbi:MAG TPA: ABC transporter permease [Trueperaceae bacterium]|nr:ABC transporter permease [Trueperaceae bacterium]
MTESFNEGSEARDEEALIHGLETTKPTSFWRGKTMKRFRRNPLAITGAIIILFYILVAVFAPQLTVDQLSTFRNTCVRDLGLSRDTVHNIANPLKGVFWRSIVAPPQSCFDIPRASYSSVPQPMSGKLWLGASSGGYDIYYGLVWGTRSAFYVGVLVVGFALILGGIVGSIAGYIGGFIDNVLMRFVDVIFSVPSLIIAIVIVTILGQSLLNVMIAIMAVQWAPYSRILRGDIMAIKERDFVDGARALGARGPRVVGRHILPNSIGPLLVIASLDIGSVVLVAAALSFLGLGAPVGYADWGQMINFARDWIQGPPGQPFAYWYVSFWPGIIIVIFVLGWNLLGDAARDVLDVRS